MDAEMREAFTKHDKTLEKIDGKVDSLRLELQTHLVASAKREERLDGHLKDHADRRKYWWGLWATAIASLVSQAWRWFSKNGNG